MPLTPKFRLYNVVRVYDTYIVAKDAEEAKAILDALIVSGEAVPMDETIYSDLTSPNDVMPSWRGEQPFVSNAISDADYARFAGCTTAEFLTRYLERKPDS